MNIFEKRSVKIRKSAKLLIPVLLLVLIAGVFSLSVNRISGDTLTKEQATLEQALRHGAVKTYALTGQYPESLSALLEDYRITYDSTRFIVDYIPNGANLFPMISVLPCQTGKGGHS